jgi:hypothetical protein
VDGEVVTATSPADLAPGGSWTLPVVMSTVVNPGGVKLLPGRSVVRPVHRSKNLRTYATLPRWTVENLISTLTLQLLPSEQLVSGLGWYATLVIGSAEAGA